MIDVGANIGYYSLIAARLGLRVVAVEPFVDSVRRIHQAALIDQIADRVTVVNNAVADRRTTATLRQSGDNQGDARIEMAVRRNDF